MQRGAQEIMEAGHLRDAAKMRQDRRVAEGQSSQQHVTHLGYNNAASEGRPALVDVTAQESRRKMQRKVISREDQEEDIENDVPLSLLVENNERPIGEPLEPPRGARPSAMRHAGSPHRHIRPNWAPPSTQRLPHQGGEPGTGRIAQPRSITRAIMPGNRREKALWRWVNTSNIDSFMRDVYDYYEGGGLWCILCSNALWLL